MCIRFKYRKEFAQSETRASNLQVVTIIISPRVRKPKELHLEPRSFGYFKAL